MSWDRDEVAQEMSQRPVQVAPLDKGNIEALVMEIHDALSTSHEFLAQLEGTVAFALRPDNEADNPLAPGSPLSEMSEHAQQLRKILGSVMHLNDRLRTIRQRVDF